METIFPETTYTTPDTVGPAWRYRISPFRSPMFYLELYRRAFGPARRMALQGKLGLPEMVQGIGVIKDTIEKTGGKFCVEGLEQVRETADQPCVFVANHMSSLETFIVPSMIFPYKSVSFIVKKSLPEHWLFGPIMREAGPITVSRENPKEDFKKVLNDGTQCLASSTSVLVFPQTTRMPCFNPEQFNSLGEKLAQRAKVPIIPIALKTDFWGIGRIFKDAGRIHPEKTIHIAFGEPLDYKLPKKQLREQILSFIVGHLADWGVPIEETPETSAQNQEK